MATASALLVIPALAAVSAVAPWASASAAHPAAAHHSAALSARTTVQVTARDSAQRAKDPSEVIVSARPGTAVAGTTVTLSATVRSSGAGPTGTTSFWWGRVELCAARLSHASTHCTAEFRVAGSYTVTARYSGDGAHASASGTTRVTATLAATRTAVSASTSSPYPGEAVTLTAAVSSHSPLVPTGTVTFSDAGGTLCTGRLGGGTAHCTAKFGAVGSYTVTARYGGDGAHASASGTTRVTATVGATSTAVTVSTLTPYPGEAVTLTAAVSSHGRAVPAGTVTFSDAGGTLCTGTLSGGTAQCNYTWNGTGSYTVTATYRGDAALAGSAGTSGAITVTQIATTTEITNINPGTISSGSSATVTVTVTTPAGTPAPTGTVQIAPTNVVAPVDPGYLCTVTLVDGTGSCQVTPPNPSYGIIDYQATYGGDTAHGKSVSTGTPELVVQDTTTTTVAFAAATGKVGTEDTITATVTNEAGDDISAEAGGTGTVTFSIGGTPISAACTDVPLSYSADTGNTATCDYTPTATGTVTVTAAYSGDAVNMASQGTGMLPVPS